MISLVSHYSLGNKTINILVRIVALLKKHNFVLGMLLVCLIVMGGIIFDQKYIQDTGKYFQIASFIVPMLVVIFSKRKLFSSFFVGLGMVLVVLIGMLAYWSYMDHPWFAGPETQTCDGPCFGWFSFENDPPVFGVAILGFYSTLLGFILHSKKLLLVTIGMLLVLFVFFVISIFKIGLADKIQKADIIHVMGVVDEGEITLPENIKRRLDVAAKLYTEGFGQNIVVYGYYNQSTPELDTDSLLKKYLVNIKEIEEDDVFPIVNSEPWLMLSDINYYRKRNSTDDKAVRSVIIVSDYFEIARGISDWEYAGKYGGEEIITTLHKNSSGALAIYDIDDIVMEFVRKIIKTMGIAEIVSV